MRRITDLKEYFDKAAVYWDEKPGRIEMTNAVADAIAAHVELDPGMKVLDFGCGTGLVSMHIAPHVQTVYAADTSREMLNVLETKIATLDVANIKTMHLENTGIPSFHVGQFDLIITSMVLHHIASISPLLCHFVSWTRRGGHIAIADLEPEDGTFHTDSNGVSHNGIDTEWLRSELTALGCKTRISKSIFVTRRNPDESGTPRSYPLFLAAARKE
ncbi:MAG: class I SAM-dependent methyltransferase [Verrucomicrobia bacterium]|nr:class I SAM-dependent methyltransferase [Verrucomicrobiota bacterium]MCF7708230.1 class I SAM-dependent methyltransferase [Verrucomicrobiota bacterium]